MRLLSYEGRNKLYYILILVIVSLSMYLGIKYVLPIFLPFIIAFLISHMLNKVVVFLNKKFKINSKIAVFLVLGVVILLMVGIIAIVAVNVVEQVKKLTDNIDKIIVVVENSVYSICDVIGKTFGIKTEKVYSAIQVNMDKMTENMSETFFDNIFISTTGLAKKTINFIILLVFTFIAIIYMTKNMDDIKRTMEKSIFAKEIRILKMLFKQVVVAYIKTTLVMFLVSSTICVIGLLILKNPYSLSLGIIIGLVDALPLIGTSVVLLPWTVISVFQGEYFYGAMLFTIFVLVYVAREYIEPKIMGKNVGISPLLSLIAIYVGYTLFGFIGMFVGPFAFVVIIRIMKTVGEKYG